MEGIMNVLRRSFFEQCTALYLPVLFFLIICTDSAFALAANLLGDYDNIAVMEVLGDYAAIDVDGHANLSPRQDVSREFFSRHGDDYDFLVIFTNFDFAMPATGSKAFFHPTRNNIEGLGLDLFDSTNLYSADGSDLRRLEGLIDMANISSHVLEPANPDFEKTLQALSHEMLHRWGAYLSFLEENQQSDALLGLGNAHWSFLLDSQGSSLYGNHWRNNGDGTFTTIAPQQAQTGSVLGRVFSPLELYMMGIYDQEQVPSLTLIDSPGIDRNRLPEVGVTIPGMLKTITVEQIVSAMGARFPAADPDREFRMGFVLLVNPGTWSADDPESLRQLQGIGNLQREWQKRFSILTNGAAILKTSLVRAEQLESNPGVTSSIAAFHVSPHVNEGVSWLLANQAVDGSWQDSSSTAQRDTATAVAALKLFPGGLSGVESGRAWLSGTSFENNDFLTRKLYGLDNVSLIGLENSQNTDGGWGSAPGYRSNPVDTAHVLTALTRNGISNGTVTAAAVNYLHAAQDGDGGWNPGLGASMVQSTASVLIALNDYRDNPDHTLEPVISNGLGWLTGKQNTDGGFGNSPSTVYDSALALSVLMTLGAPQADTNSAIDFLLASQFDSGSWNGSAFQTAMTVQALYAGMVQADLQVETGDISIDPYPVISMPADVTLSVQVWNNAEQEVAAVKVALFQGDPSLGVLEGEAEVSVTGHSFVKVEFPIHIANSGAVTYFVSVDADQLVDEAREINNLASRTFEIGEQPTLSFDPITSGGPESVGEPVLKVSLSHAWDQIVTVNLDIDPSSTATLAQDYQLSTGELTFNPGETLEEISLMIVNDLQVEDDERIALNLSNPLNAGLGHKQATYTILDDDIPPIIGFRAPATDGQEDVGIVSAVVELSFAAQADVAVDFAISEPASEATPGEDVVLAPGTLIIPTGETTAEINFIIVDDTVEEPEEKVVIKLTNSQGALLGVDVFSYTILDNDALPQVVITSPVANQVVSSGQVTLQYQTNMPEAQVTVYLDDVAVITRAGQPLVIQGNGTFTVRVVATNVNLVTAQDVVSFGYDDSGTPPLMVWERAGNIIRNSYHSRFDQLGYSDYGGLFVDGLNDDLDFDPVEQSFYARFDQNNTLRKKHNFPGTWNMHTHLHDAVTTKDKYSLLEFLDYTGEYSIRVFSTTTDSQLDMLVVPHESGLYLWEQFAIDSTAGFFVAGLTREGIAKNAVNDGGNIKLIRLDAGGNQLWSQTHATTATETVVDIITDREDNLYLLGTTAGYLGKSGGASAGGKDMFLIKIDREGNTLWRGQWGTGLDDEARDLALDNQGNLLLLGATHGSFDGTLPAYEQDSFFVKIDADGHEIWLKQDHTISSPRAIATAAMGEIVLAGGYGFYNSGVEAICQIRWSAYGPDGENLWHDTLAAGSNQYDSNVSDLLIDPYGNMFVTINWNPGYWELSSTTLRKYSSNFDQPPPFLTVDPYSFDPVTGSLLLTGNRLGGAGISLRVDSQAIVGPVDLSDVTRWSCTVSWLLSGRHTITIDAIGSNGLVTSRDIVLDVAQPTPFAAGLEVRYGTARQEIATASTLTDQDLLYIVGQENLADNTSQDVSSWQTTAGGISSFVTMDTALVEGGRAVAKDANGSVYLAWNSVNNSFVGKFNADGSTAWSSDYSSGKGVQAVEGVAVDAQGNVYITGYTTNSPDRKVAHGGGLDYFLVKFDSNGVTRWARLTGPGHPGDQTASGIDLDSLGNVYIVGNTQETLHDAAALNNSFVIKYSGQGDLLWTKILGASHPGVAKDVVVDSADNIYVVGDTDLLAGQKRDGYIAKYSPDGVREWLDVFSVSAGRDEFVADAGLDKDGNILITGHVLQEIDDTEIQGASDVFWTKYDVSGRILWYERFGTPFADYPAGIHGTSLGAVLITGYAGNLLYGDYDLFVREFNPSPLTPDLIVDQADSTTPSRSIYLTGHVSLDAQMVITADTPISSTAIVGAININPADGAWSCLVSDLVANAHNTLTVRATNSYGSASQAVITYVDTMPPGLSIVAVPATTDLPNQLFSGSVERGALLTVVVNQLAAPVVVTETDGNWVYVANLLEGSNDITFKATDGVGNATVHSLTITRLPPAPPSIAVSPVTLKQDEPSDVVLTINNPNGIGSSVYVAMLYDVTGDGFISGDISVRKFQLYDGVSSSNPNVPGDEDGVANGRLTTTLNFQYLYDVQKTPGLYIFYVGLDGNAKTAPFSITETSQAQTIQGYVINDVSAPIVGARVQLFDKWRHSYGYAYTDAAGHYLFNVVSPGTYYLIPTSRHFAFEKISMQPQVLGGGQNLNLDLTMISGSVSVGGLLMDSVTSGILVGGNYVRVENDQYIAEAYDLAHSITTTDNVFKYICEVPPGGYDFYVDTYNSRGAYAQGYISYEGAVGHATSGLNIYLDKASELVCGQVIDQAALPLAGVVVVARPDSGTGQFSSAITDTNGDYCIGVTDNGSWQIAINDMANQSVGYVSNHLDGITATAGPFYGNNLSVYLIDAWLGGSVLDDGSRPVAGVPVDLTDVTTGVKVKGATTFDGSYRLGVFAGNWSVKIFPESSGYQSVNPVAVTLATGQTVTQDFQVSILLEAPFVDVTVQSPTDQSTQIISGSRSMDASISVVVDNGATVGPVVPVTATTWQCTISNLEEGVNIVSVSASNGVATYHAPDAYIDFQLVQTPNTIMITEASYTTRKRTLAITATSDYPDAALVAEYAGMSVPMDFGKFFKSKYSWTYSVTNLETAPATVVVSGSEGSLTAPVTVK